jgi:hypothetical protein
MALSGPAIALCSRLGVQRQLPAADDMVAVAEGVIEADDVEGIRYTASEELTGWFLMPAAKSTPDEFTLIHAIHLFETRPDIARFLALPPGWSFDTSDSGHVWFDTSIQDHEAI